MKKCFLILSLLISSVFIYGQSMNIEETMQKAKEYENKKQWIYALGEYYDLMENYQTYEIEDAYNNFIRLSKLIREGKPGYGETDIFSIEDNWILLLQDYEKYWTEYSPYAVGFEKPELSSINKELKTANYKVKTYLVETVKFRLFKEIVKNGLGNAYQNSWDAKYLKSWPEISVYNKVDSYFPNNTAIVVDRNVCYEDSNDKEIKDVDYTDDLNLKEIVFDFPKTQLASTTLITSWIKEDRQFWKTGRVYKYWRERDSVSLLTVDFSFVNSENNNILFSCKNCTARNGLYEIADVPQDVVKLLDFEKTDITLDRVILKYGKIKNYVMKGQKNNLAFLSEFEIDKKNISCQIWNRKIPVENVLNSVAHSIELHKRELDEKQKIIDIRENDNKLLNEDKKATDEVFKEILKQCSILTVTKISPTKKINGKEIILLPNKVYISNNYIYDLQEKYGNEKLETAYKMILCNEISIQKKLTPYYLINSPTEKKFSDVLEFCLNHFDEIKIESKNLGFHIPESTDIEFIRQKAKSTDIKYIMSAEFQMVQSTYMGIKNNMLCIVRTIQ